MRPESFVIALARIYAKILIREQRFSVRAKTEPLGKATWSLDLALQPTHQIRRQVFGLC